MRLKLDKRTGPLYWCTYEKQFTENTFMPEERFKENIDWVAKDLFHMDTRWYAQMDGSRILSASMKMDI